MNPEQIALADALEQKLRKVSELETEIAPRGINFAVRGQESVYKSGTCHLPHPEAAVDAVIAALSEAKEARSRRKELFAKALTLPE